MSDISFLDCTLRDGAHVVSGDFKYQRIINILNGLTSAKSDIIEFGFLKNVTYNSDKVYYPDIQNAIDILNSTESSANTPIYALMARADEYDYHLLPVCNNRIRLIRVAFYYDYLEGGIKFARKAMDKGYICSLNLINTPGSTMDELKTFIEQANTINPFAVSIVDTFGVLDIARLEQIVYLYDSTLNPMTRIGLHVHENMSLSFALAQHFLNIVDTNRDVIIDGSLMGIGRAPGNLCTELITEYLDTNYHKNIDIHTIIDTLDKEVRPLKDRFKWGYSPEFFLSAKHRVHRSYAEFLAEHGVSLSNIDTLLGMIPYDTGKKFNQTYILEMAKKEGIL